MYMDISFTILGPSVDVTFLDTQFLKSLGNNGACRRQLNVRHRPPASVSVEHCNPITVINNLGITRWGQMS